MSNIVQLPTRQEQAAAVRAGGGSWFSGSQFDDVPPDYYAGSFDRDLVVWEYTAETRPLGKSVVRLVIEPPIEAADEEDARQRYSGMEFDNLLEVVHDKDGKTSTMVLEAPGSQPPATTASVALNALNYARDYRLSREGVYGAASSQVPAMPNID